MWIHERTHARILALTRCSTTRIRVEPRTHMRTRARVYSRSFARSPVCWCMCTHRTAANTHIYVHICMHAYRYMTRAYTDTCKRSSPLSLCHTHIHTHAHTHSPSFSFALFFAFAPSLSRLLPLSFLPLRILSVYPLIPYLPSAPFKCPLPNFLLFLSLIRFPLLLYAFVSLYSIPSLSVSPKLLPPSLATAYTVEAAQAAEGHRSQLWTYLDRQARSEVWTSFARRPCRRC